MSLRKPLFILCGSLLIAALVTVVVTPIAVATGVKLWIARAARQQGLRVTLGAVDAPLLRPVVIHDAVINSIGSDDVALRLKRAELDLRLAAWLDPSRGRLLRNLIVQGLRGDLRKPSVANSSAPADWHLYARLLADTFSIEAPSVTFRSGVIAVELRDLTLSADETEPGAFHATRASVVSPWFDKTFEELRGGTTWQFDRLTIGGIALMRGLDLDVAAFDFSHLSENRIGIDASIDVFGGRLRARMSAENRGADRIWDIVGSGTEVSLARMSDALQFSNRASGSIHACKLTFRGSFADPGNATASLWTEVTGLTWRDRTADVVMLGASLYSRQIQVEQLYVKQRKNELTLSGESALPQSAADWPDFRGDVSAAIADLGSFARLFGANAADFSGEISVNGNITEHEHAFGGQVTAAGNSLKLFGAPIDTLDAQLVLRGSELRVGKCELRRDRDSLRLDGTLQLSPERRFSGSFDAATVDLSKYSGVHALHRFRGGSLHTNVAIDGSLQHPEINGEVQLSDATVSDLGAISAHMLFNGATGTIDAARLSANGVSADFGGEIDLTDTSAVAVTLRSSRPLLANSPAGCINDITLSTPPPAGSQMFTAVELRGALFQPRWNVSLRSAPDSSGTERSFEFCGPAPGEGEMLALSFPPK